MPTFLLQRRGRARRRRSRTTLAERGYGVWAHDSWYSLGPARSSRTRRTRCGSASSTTTPPTRSTGFWSLELGSFARLATAGEHVGVDVPPLTMHTTRPPGFARWRPGQAHLAPSATTRARVASNTHGLRGRRRAGPRPTAVDELPARVPTSSGAARGRRRRRRTTLGSRSRPARRLRATRRAARRLGLGGDDARRSGRQRLHRASRCPSSARRRPTGRSTASNARQSSHSSRPMVPLPGHHRVVLDRVHEQPVDAVVAAVDHRLPPDLVRHGDRPRRRAARPRRAWRAARASGATMRARTPSSRAAHATPCAMFPALAVTTPPASPRRRRAHRRQRAAQLERADRLQVLELQPDRARRAARAASA